MPEHYDVFLSYATADNSVLARPWNEQDRWVMCFKVALQQALNRELGREGSAKWFLDAKDLRTGANLSAKIKAALDDTTLFVALASNGYFHDDSWCKMEREHFITSLGPEPDKQERMFGVLLDESALPLWKEKVFPEVRAFPFYAKNAATEESMRLGEGEIDPTFIQRVATLARDLASRIREIERNSPTEDASTDSVRGTVFLAAVPGEIEEDRTELAGCLTGAGWRVIPAENVCHQEFEICQQESEERAKDALAFVQLLSPHPWKPFAYDQAQFEGAKKAIAPIFRFRSDEIDLAKVKTPEHRQWLEAHDVAARSMPSIKNELFTHLNKLLQGSLKEAIPTAEGSEGEDSAFITLSVAKDEQPTIGQLLSDRLKRKNVYALMPRETTFSFEDCLLKEHGLLTVFGNEPYDRVEKALLEWRFLLAKYRRKPGTAPPIGIFLSEPPPVDKVASINMTLPGLKVLAWNDESEFESFVDAIRTYVQKVSSQVEIDEKA